MRRELEQSKKEIEERKERCDSKDLEISHTKKSCNKSEAENKKIEAGFRIEV